MKKNFRTLFLFLIFLGVMAILLPSYSTAFEPITLNECSEITFFGWFRNNSGIFLQDQPYAQDGNQLATERTWVRGYVDYKISDHFRFWSAVEFAYEPWYETETHSSSSLVPPQQAELTKKGGKEYSEYNDVNDILRECYFEWKPNQDVDIKLGRQIVIWGEALTTRVGDVIHPDNGRFTFAFANLEDTRIPSWMIRGVFNINALNSFLELIYNPNLVKDVYTVTWSPNPAIPAAGLAGQRFAIHAADQPFIDYIPFTVRGAYPHGWKGDARGGFRTNTLLGGYSFGISYFHTQEYNPLLKRGSFVGMVGPFELRNAILVHPNKDIIGFYLNKQLTGTAPIPGVLRTEAIFVPNQPFNTFATSDSDRITRREYIKYLIGYDLNGYFYPSWHNTAPINLTLEHVGEIIPNNNNVQYITYHINQRKWNPSITGNLSTNWRYNQWETSIIASYFPWGRSGLFMPIVKYTSPKFNQNLSVEFRYICLFGNSNYTGLGIFKNKDMLVLTTQFNW